MVSITASDLTYSEKCSHAYWKNIFEEKHLQLENGVDKQIPFNNSTDKDASTRAKN